jgi:CrcB protein
MTWLYIWIWWFFWAISRYFLTKFWNYILPHNVPFWTLLVNVIWSFIIGILFGIFFYYSVDIRIKSLVVTGFLGALTTFSTFAIESFFLFDWWNYKHFFYNVLANFLWTILFVAIWFYLAKFVVFYFFKW